MPATLFNEAWGRILTGPLLLTDDVDANINSTSLVRMPLPLRVGTSPAVMARNR